MIGMNDTVDTTYVKMGDYVLKYSYFGKDERKSTNNYVDNLVINILDHKPNLGYKYLCKDQDIRTLSLIGKGDPKEVLDDIYNTMIKKLSKKYNRPATVITDFYKHDSITGVLTDVGEPMEFEYVV